MMGVGGHNIGASSVSYRHNFLVNIENGILCVLIRIASMRQF